MGAGPWRILPTWRETAGLALSGLALSGLAVGAILFGLPPFAEPPLGHQVAATALVQVVWCYCDGIVGRLDWGLAALEGLLRLKVALSWAGLLVEAC